MGREGQWLCVSTCLPYPFPHVGNREFFNGDEIVGVEGGGHGQGEDSAIRERRRNWVRGVYIRYFSHVAPQPDTHSFGLSL